MLASLRGCLKVCFAIVLTLAGVSALLLLGLYLGVNWLTSTSSSPESSLDSSSEGSVAVPSSAPAECDLAQLVSGESDLSWAHCDFSGAQLAGAQLVGAQLDGIHLEAADLTAANLFGAHLNGAWLTGAKLANADVTAADLRAAHLDGISAAAANLTGATLTGADLTGADLTRAELAGAELCSANLTQAILDSADLAVVSYDASTIWPDGFLPPGSSGSENCGSPGQQAYDSSSANRATVVVGVADRLNLRAGPGTAHAILAKLSDGDQVAILGRSSDNEWLRVRITSGLEGWVFAVYLACERPVSSYPLLTESTLQQ